MWQSLSKIKKFASSIQHKERKCTNKKVVLEKKKPKSRSNELCVNLFFDAVHCRCRKDDYAKNETQQLTSSNVSSKPISTLKRSLQLLFLFFPLNCVSHSFRFVCFKFLHNSREKLLKYCRVYITKLKQVRRG